MQSAPQLVLRLFVCTYAVSSTRAIRNLTQLLEERFSRNYRLEIIDIQKNPLIALKENVIAVPLLLRIAPGPLLRMVGDMSDLPKVLAKLLPADH